MARADINELADAVLGHDIRALARAATLIERETEESERLIDRLFHATGSARILGVTGPPGAGKSTLISQIIKALRSRNHRVGVIAIDPTSPISGGAILGDRIRMSEHSADSDVYVRSLASRGFSGGLAAATLNMTVLLDAAGFDIILIETVGVGQDETAIANFAETTIVVLTPLSGDDVQAIKAGVMEVADVFVINKSDLPGAETLEGQIRFVQSLSATGARTVPVHRVSANDGTGIDVLVRDLLEQCGEKEVRSKRIQAWTELIARLIEREVRKRVDEAKLSKRAAMVSAREMTPRAAVLSLLEEVVR